MALRVTAVLVGADPFPYRRSMREEGKCHERRKMNQTKVTHTTLHGCKESCDPIDILPSLPCASAVNKNPILPPPTPPPQPQTHPFIKVSFPPPTSKRDRNETEISIGFIAFANIQRHQIKNQNERSAGKGTSAWVPPPSAGGRDPPWGSPTAEPRRGHLGAGGWGGGGGGE